MALAYVSCSDCPDCYETGNKSSKVNFSTLQVRSSICENTSAGFATDSQFAPIKQRIDNFSAVDGLATFFMLRERFLDDLSLLFRQVVG